MKKLFYLFFCFVTTVKMGVSQNKGVPLTKGKGEVTQQHASKTQYCAADILNEKLSQGNNTYKQKFDRMNTKWQTYAVNKANEIITRQANKDNNSTQANFQSETLPVVFHMLLDPNTSTDPNANVNDENLTLAQQQTALANLNAIYSGSATGSKSAGLNTSIQFCLARVNNSGNAITTYTYTNALYTSPLNNSDIPQITAWSNIVQATGKFPTTKYINVYVVKDIVAPVAGFAFMPPAHGSAYDGIYIEAQYLLAPTTGTNDLSYNMTVLAHEMGHYLGLFHTFGLCTPNPGLTNQSCACDNSNCLFNGDMVCDTPPDFSSNPTAGGCATSTNTCHTDVATTHDALYLTSDVPDLTDNYMDYGDWNCQYKFTQGQINRMHFMIDQADGPRNSLLNSNVCNVSCAGANCTVSITSPTATIGSGASAIQLPNTLILSGPSVSNNFTGQICSPFYNTFNWQTINLATNVVVQTGTGTNFNATFNATGNYRILLTSSVAGSNPLCSQTATLDIQVLPPANCPNNLDMSSGWQGGNWQRTQYEGGWARTQNNGTAFQLATSSFTTIPTNSPNSDKFEIVNSLSADPNFQSLAMPPGVTNIMRVGSMIAPTTTIAAGDANYVTYTFSPTIENSKIRVYFLGMTQNDNGNYVRQTEFATESNGCRNAFGAICHYDFNSVTNPGNIARIGTTQTGWYDVPFHKNDWISGTYNYNVATYTTAIGSRTMNVMSNWQFIDMDFSEFICASPTITITFFARSDNANTPGFHHSYAYFGATCMPGNYKNIDLNLPNKDLSCMSNVSTNCIDIPLPPPNNYSAYENGSNNPYPPFYDVKVERSNDNITYTPVSAQYQLSYDINYNVIPIVTLCKTADNYPYIYYRVTIKTMCQTKTSVFSLHQGFYHHINACYPDSMSGGRFINPPVITGTNNISPDQYVQFCGSTTLSLQRPCWLSPTEAEPEYKWQYQNGSWIDIQNSNTPTLTVTADVTCMPYRRVAKYLDPYCNTPTWISSDIFYLTSLKDNRFLLTTTGPDLCGYMPSTVNINNFRELYNITQCDLELNAQVATAAVTNSISFAFYSNSNCIPSNSLTAMTGPSVVTFTYLNTLAWPTAPLNTAFTFFNNGIYNTNDNVFVVGTVTRFGCQSTFTTSIPIKIKPSATAGTITTNTCLDPVTTAINGNNPNTTGYYWQYSYNSSFSPTLSLTSNTNYSVSIPSNTFTIFPVYVRRVANGTSDCPNPAYSNTLVISDNSLTIGVVKNTDICSGSCATVTANGATSYTWTSPTTATTSINPFITCPTVTTIYTVTGTDNLGCSNTQTTSVTILPSPNLSVSASSNTICLGNTTTLTASGTTYYEWDNGASTNSIVVSPTISTTYTVAGANSNGCVSTKTISITVISGASFNLSASSLSVCSGNCSTLTCSGVNTYTWLPANTNGTSSVVCPTIATTYTVIGLQTGALCSSTNTITINVLPNPTVSIVGTMSLCPGNSTTLTASGGGTYSWSPSGVTTASMVTNTTGVKTVTVTGINGCKAIQSATVGSYPNSTFTITPTTANVCLGSSYTFTGSTSPATAYTWMPGGITTYTANFSPTSTTIYTVTGRNKGAVCPIIKTVTLTVLPNPTVTISQYLTICQGGTTTASATGGGTYLWSTGATNYSTSVNMTGPVTVTVTGSNGCNTIATTTVNWGIDIHISPVTSTICSGTSSVLTGSGNASTYTWMPGNLNGNPITVSPTSTTIYTLSGTKGSCTGVLNATVYVIPSPTANISGSLTICYNTTTLTATGGGTYLWDTGITTSTIAVNTTGVKTVTVTAANGCTSVKSVTITQPGPPQCYNPARIGSTGNDSKSNTTIFHAIYPNPANHSFSISNPDELFLVEIYDYTGKIITKILNENETSFENIDIKYFPSGIYMIRLIDRNKNAELFKLIKE